MSTHPSPLPQLNHSPSHPSLFPYFPHSSLFSFSSPVIILSFGCTYFLRSGFFFLLFILFSVHSITFMPFPLLPFPSQSQALQLSLCCFIGWSFHYLHHHLLSAYLFHSSCSYFVLKLLTILALVYLYLKSTAHPAPISSSSSVLLHLKSTTIILSLHLFIPPLLSFCISKYSYSIISIYLFLLFCFCFFHLKSVAILFSSSPICFCFSTLLHLKSTAIL